MKKITTFFILVILLSFVSCDTITHYTMMVSVDRNPNLIIENRTGHQVVVTAPVSLNINNGASTQFQPDETIGTINIAYRIGQIQFTEQATMDNADVTVTLTKRPATLTIMNNVGTTINTIFLRIPGSPNWVGGNIVIRDGTVQLAAAGGAQTGDVSGSIANKDSVKLWLGNVDLSGNIFDIKIDDVQTNSYIKNNVQVMNDMTQTFTQADKR